MKCKEAGTVKIYPARMIEPEHEKTVHHELGRRIAQLLGMRFGGEYDGLPCTERQYLIPTDTIIGTRCADQLGLSQESDLFGGIAPYGFLPTKAITHSLYNIHAMAPDGWSHEFGEHIRDCVLRGYTAFSLPDATEAGRLLLNGGPVRIKPVTATAGRGQLVVSDFGALQEALGRQDFRALSQYGLVLEAHLDFVETFSVGQVRLGGNLASYIGTQRLTPDNQGDMVYGGSELIVSRGGFDQLLKLEFDENQLNVIDKAQQYDQAVDHYYPSLIASRRNYDVARGRDANGSWCTGVLEQSWRIGGASAAEIAALEAFHNHDDVNVVVATTTEVFGADVIGPEDAIPLFQGVDSEIGPVSKFLNIKPYDN